MKQIVYSVAGNGNNEDSYYVENKFGFVLDGATGLLKERITQEKSDARWFALHMTEKLKTLLKENKTIKEIVSQAIVDVDNIYMSFTGAKEVKSKPSAGVAIYRILGDKLEYFLLGDVSLLMEYKNGEVKELQLQTLPYFDAQNIEKMVQIAKEKHIDVVNAMQLINEDLVRVRLSQNTDSGYYILSDNTNAVNHALTGFVSTCDIASLTLLSDGFSQVYDTFDLYKSPKDLVNALKHKKAEEIYQELFNAQEKDKTCNAHPRFKLRDDATILHVEL